MPLPHPFQIPTRETSTTFPDGVYTGVVRGLSSGDSPGPASAMSYRIVVNFPHQKQEISGVRPAADRWPDQVKVRALQPGTAVLVAVVQGRLQLTERELPHFAPCQQQISAPPQSADQFILSLSQNPERLAQLAALLKGVK